MGTPGVPVNIPRVKIVEALKKYKGRLTLVAKELDICYVTLRRQIDPFPELCEMVASLRNEYETSLLDLAENTLTYALDQKEKDLPNSLKASFFVLNNRGKKRGYSPHLAPEGSEDKLAGMRDGLKEISNDT